MRTTPVNKGLVHLSMRRFENLLCSYTYTRKRIADQARFVKTQTRGLPTCYTTWCPRHAGSCCSPMCPRRLLPLLTRRP